MRSSRLILPTLAIAIVLGPVQARAADSVRVVSPTSAATRPTSSDDARMSEEVRAQVESHRAQARALWEAGRSTPARREYVAASRLMRKSGVVPTDELMAAATVALAEGRPRLAAELMDALAECAAAFGQPAVRAQALLEAVTQYADAGEMQRAHQRHAELRTLLASPDVPDSIRADVSARIAVADEDRAVVARR